jgi:cytochrome c oxidase subunit 4
MTAPASIEDGPMKSEQKVLNLICIGAAVVFLAFIGYNFIAAGSFISTDGLFFAVVMLVLALSFLAVPAQQLIAQRMANKALAAATEQQPHDAAPEPVVLEDTHMMEVEHFAGSNRFFFSIWIWLLVLTGFEVFLGYKHLPVIYMLVILMGVSIVKAALIVAYFMHLRFERLNLVLTIVPALVICICLLLVFFPDSFRARDLRYQGAQPPAENH